MNALGPHELPSAVAPLEVADPNLYNLIAAQRAVPNPVPDERAGVIAGTSLCRVRGIVMGVNLNETRVVTDRIAYAVVAAHEDWDRPSLGRIAPSATLYIPALCARAFGASAEPGFEVFSRSKGSSAMSI